MNNNSANNLITARGTANGLVIKLTSEVSEAELIPAIREYIEARKSFLAGNQVILDWTDGIPDDTLAAAVEVCLEKDFDINVKEKSVTTSSLDDGSEQNFMPRRGSAESTGSDADSDAGLLGGLNVFSDDSESFAADDTDAEFSRTNLSVKSSSSEQRQTHTQTGGSNLSNSMFWDNPDAMIVHATMRSGQRIETENSIVLLGDLNCGAEIIAAGDVIVLGTLRGVVHAGAYDETGGGRFIYAQELKPTQLRIGSVISRGAEKSINSSSGEIAYVDGNAIVVEKYNARSAANRLR